MMLPCHYQFLQAKGAIDADCVTYRSLPEAITCKLVTFFDVERGSVEKFGSRRAGQRAAKPLSEEISSWSHRVLIEFGATSEKTMSLMLSSDVDVSELLKCLLGWL